MRLKDYVKPIMVAGSIALTGCDNLEQTSKKIELAFSDMTRSQVSSILNVTHCQPIKFTEEELKTIKQEDKQKEELMGITIQKLIMERDYEIKALQKKIDFDIDTLYKKRNKYIEGDPEKLQDIRNWFFKEQEKIEVLYSSQKKVIESDFLNAKNSTELAYFSNPKLKEYFKYKMYEKNKEECEIKSQLNNEGIQEYDRLSKEEENELLKIINQEKEEQSEIKQEDSTEWWKTMNQEITILWNKAKDQEEKSKIIYQYLQNGTEYLNQSYKKLDQITYKYNQKKYNLLNEYRKNKQALLDNFQYRK